MTQQRGKVTKIVAFVIIPLVILSVIKVDAREFSKCEFAREIRKYFPEEEVAACKWKLLYYERLDIIQ